jgi:hypothetical protein
MCPVLSVTYLSGSTPKFFRELVTRWVHWLVRSWATGRILVGLKVVEILPVVGSNQSPKAIHTGHTKVFPGWSPFCVLLPKKLDRLENRLFDVH